MRSRVWVTESGARCDLLLAAAQRSRVPNLHEDEPCDAIGQSTGESNHLGIGRGGFNAGLHQGQTVRAQTVRGLGWVRLVSESRSVRLGRVAVEIW
jgi:hypothetical protein